ncbi:MAG: glycerol-3-phosphate dehydrogenase/oxidase [Chloroflexi bacterium]|nr:glycerol-3-phosphate dehydrogenase/oxidase [Chloroflexota bacterium]
MRDPAENVENRQYTLRLLETERFDLCVVGGGITGVGIALDAATRGLHVALLEQEDFAAGTSSRTTKLIHGGLRYLAQGQFKVTREASIERRHLLKLAPDLVKPLQFVAPIHGFADRLIMEAGLTGYDLLASLQNVRNHYAISRSQLYHWFPILRGAEYSGGLVYYDAQTDDARLTIMVAREAARYGALIANHCQVMKLQGEKRVDRLLCRDTLTGREFLVQARRVILATGVWIDDLLGSGQQRPALVRPAKGVHLILPQHVIGSKRALLMRFPEDKRYVFAIPWKGRTLLGTTDTNYNGPLDAPPVSEEDVHYLLQVLHVCAPFAKATETDILGAQAGLRPLVNKVGKSADAISREDRIIVDPRGFLTIIGGKLTTYRSMARKAVDQAVGLLISDGILSSFPASRTGEVPIGGFPLGKAGEIGRDKLRQDLRAVFDEEVTNHLLASYAAGAQEILRLALQQPDLKERIVPELPVLRVEALYATQAEWALTLDDVLTRRLGLTLLAPRSTLDVAHSVAQLIAPLVGWNSRDIDHQFDLYKEVTYQHTWPPTRA